MPVTKNENGEKLETQARVQNEELRNIISSEALFQNVKRSTGGKTNM